MPAAAAAPRGGRTGQSTGQGRAQGPGQGEERAGKSLEGNEGHGVEQRRCADWGDHGMQREEELGTGGQGELSPVVVRGQKLFWERFEEGRVRRLFPGWYGGFECNHLEATFAWGSTWVLVRVRPAFLGRCRNISSHPAQQENLKMGEFAPKGGGSKSTESHKWGWELWAYVAC